MIPADTETMAEVGGRRNVAFFLSFFSKKRKSLPSNPFCFVFCRFQWECIRDREQPLQCSVHGQLVILQMDLW